MTNEQTGPPQPSPQLAPAAPASEAESKCAARQSWRSEELLGDRTEVLILHNAEVYRLRLTRQGKLILYK